jgi:monoamine oxidase
MSRSFFARLNQRYGRRIDAVTRRGFLRATLAASAGLMLSNTVGCESAGKPVGPKAGAGRIAVIGAGVAGLSCAYELASAGYDVTVLDPRSRVGGRVFSSSTFIEGKNVELGGELIGSNHPMWVAYAKKFGLEFLDVTEDEKLEAPLVFEGKVIESKEGEKLWEELDAALNTLNAAAEPIDADEPWKAPGAAMLDKQTLAHWHAKVDCSDLCRRALKAQLSSDNAVELDKQSYLAMLTGIKGGGGEKYWTESEVYRCKGGNQQVALKLAEAIGKERILLKTAAKTVTETDKGVTITCDNGKVILADEVVLAAPPSVWEKIAFTPPLPVSLRTQMGTAVKHLSSLKKRFWKDNGLAPDSLSDGDVSQTWDGTDNQLEGDAAGMVAFSGGDAAVRARTPKEDARTAAYKQQLETRYAGYGENVVKTIFMDWPGDPNTMAGYSFPAPGDITRAGPMLRAGRGKVQFAGEHTCYKFAGYMEGGLSSGAELAKRIAVRDGVVKAAGPAERALMLV